MKFIKLSKLAVATGLTLMFSACTLTDLDINRNPNAPSVVTNKLLLPTAIINSYNSYLAAEGQSHLYANLLGGGDPFNINNQSFNGTWNGYYRGMNAVEKIIQNSANSPHYLGIAQVLKAMTAGNMVDMFGDVPYSEAWKGDAETPVTNPKFDKDSEIYEDCIKLCNEAIANLAKASPVRVDTEAGDLLYSGNISKWTKLAKSVKIRLLLNSRKGRATGNADLVAAFNAGGYITAPADDYIWRYSTQTSPVDGRHPWFQSAYLADNGFTYSSHQLMEEMLFEKDPRFPFYFYRQTDVALDVANPTDRGTIPFGGTYLVTKPTFLAKWEKTFGTAPNAADLKFIAGLFGRDRGDNTGVPQDGAIRTAPGAYPAGGLYGGREIPAKALTGGRGQGNGYQAILTSNNMKWYQIEAILDAGLAGDAKAVFEAAIREHISRVNTIGLSVDPSNAKAMVASEIDAYVKAQVAKFEAAPSNAAKLNVAKKAEWFCSYGQATEMWNSLRRTGFPSTIQNPILKPARQFSLRFPYPSQEGTLNTNAAEKVKNVIWDVDPIFWDKLKLKWEF